MGTNGKLDRNRDKIPIDCRKAARAREAGQLLGASTGARQEQGQHIRGKVGRYREVACAVGWTDIWRMHRSYRQKQEKHIRGKVGRNRKGSRIETDRGHAWEAG